MRVNLSPVYHYEVFHLTYMTWIFSLLTSVIYIHWSSSQSAILLSIYLLEDADGREPELADGVEVDPSWQVN